MHSISIRPPHVPIDTHKTTTHLGNSAPEIRFGTTLAAVAAAPLSLISDVLNKFRDMDGRSLYYNSYACYCLSISAKEKRRKNEERNFI